PLGPQVTRHLLVLEGLARRLALAGRPVAAMRDRDAVAGAQAAEIMPLHRPSEPLADAGADDIDKLAREKMRHGDFRAEFQQRIGGDTKLGETRLRLDLGLCEMTALRFRDVLGFG